MNRVLFDCDYISRDDKPVIRLFYRTENGWDIVEDPDFQPYFYAISDFDDEELIEELKDFNDIVSIEKEKKIDVEGEINVLKLTVKHPKVVPELRQLVKEVTSCKEIREADILFHRRYLIDKQLTPMDGVEKLNPKIAAIDIEVYSEKGTIDSKANPITMLSYADTAGIKKVVINKSTEVVKDERAIYVNSEKELLETFVSWVAEHDPELIVGYNTDNFDFPYISDRAEKNKVKLNLGADGSALRLRQAGMTKEAQMAGRQHIDLYPVCRRLFNLPRYRLDDVYTAITNEVKEDLTLDEMNKFWIDDEPKTFQKLIDYSISDVEACVRISEGVIGLQYELARMVGQITDEVSRMGSGMRVEYFLMRKAFERNIITPKVPGGHEMQDRMNKPVKGAFVVDPVTGVHDNLLLFDFRSLYPSIIISHNVDPATIDCDCCEEDVYTAPTGTKFCKKQKGFIPTVLREILEKRVSIKAKLKEEKDEFQKQILDVQQQAVKILANSAYGYFGFARARWYSRECAAAITGWGRQYIHETITASEKAGFKVVYGDTDSVYLTLPGDLTREEIMTKANSFRTEINKELPEAMELEFEGFYPRGLFVTKKRYALMDTEGKLSIKGLETRRRDWADLAKKTQEKILNIVLSEKDAPKAAEYAKAVIERVKEGKVPLEELTIHTQLTRKIGDYVSEGPHVLAAKKAMKEGMEFGEGSIISYIVTTKKADRIGDKAKIVDFVDEGDYDPNYYINNQILPACMRVLEAFDYTEDELKGMGKQMKLGGW